MSDAVKLLERYWKAGCQCRSDTTALCKLCQETFELLKAEGIFAKEATAFQIKGRKP